MCELRSWELNLEIYFRAAGFVEWNLPCLLHHIIFYVDKVNEKSQMKQTELRSYSIVKEKCGGVGALRLCTQHIYMHINSPKTNKISRQIRAMYCSTYFCQRPTVVTRKSNDNSRRWQIGKNGRTLFDRPKPAVGCSANGRRRSYVYWFLRGKYLEEYMVLNMKTGNGKVGRIEN